MQNIIGSIKNRSRSSSLSFRLLAYILVFSSGITLLVTVLQLFTDYRRDMLSIEERLNQIEESHVNGLISSLWDMNDRQTRTLMDGILSLPDIAHVEILDNNDASLASTGRFPVGDTLDREYVLSYTDREEKRIFLGTLQVTADLDGVYQRLRERLLIILGSQAVKTFLVSIFILILFQQLVTRHLAQLARHTSNIAATRDSPPLTLDRKPNPASRLDELDQVVLALNHMHAGALDANKKIQQLNASLEDRVVERTRSLYQEIQDRVKAEKELEKLAAVVKHTGELISLASPDGRMVFLNEAGGRMLGIDPREVAHLQFMDVIPEHLADLVDGTLLPTLKGGGTWSGDLQYRNLSTGRVTDVHATLFTVDDPDSGTPQFLANVSMDITGRKRAEQKIKASLKEKEILLKEVHHRVKNNLQVVSGLLGLQAYTMEDRVEPETLALFRESATRIKSMALVHERLQCSSDFAHVDFEHYIRQLAGELFHNYRIHSDNITLDIQTEGVQVNIDQAVPCGLIVNELLSNALKHAFSNGRGGRIEISLTPGQGKMLELGVCDDGKGLPESLDLERVETLGLTIVNALVEQLGGEMVLDRTQGTCFRISFAGV